MWCGFDASLFSLSALARHAIHQTTFVLHDDLTKRFFWQAASSVIFYYSIKQKKPSHMDGHVSAKLKQVSANFRFFLSLPRAFVNFKIKVNFSQSLQWWCSQLARSPHCSIAFEVCTLRNFPPSRPLFPHRMTLEISRAQLNGSIVREILIFNDRIENSRKCCFRLSMDNVSG